MPFLTRNRYYLRVSSSKTIPLYVYLDNQHVDWMSDQILRKVVADLRLKVGPKLRAEYDAHVGSGPAPAGAKRGTVDVHRGDTYQFAYFLRESEPYSVLIKTRNFVLAPEPPVTKSDSAPTVTEKKAGKQKKSSSRKKRRKVKGGRATGQNEEDDDYNPSDSGLRDGDDIQADENGDFEMTDDLDASTTKGTRGANDPTAKVDVKVEQNEEDLPQTRPTTSVPTESSHVEDTGPGIPIVVDDDEEPKPKLALDLKYRAFPNFNRCLCVVVEPWPSQTSGSYSRAPSLAPSTVSRAPSVTPTISEFGTNRGQRARTPLFLPDLDDESLIPGHSRFRTLPPVPLFDDDPSSISRDTDDMEGEWVENTSLMQFSQMLSATGRAGGADVEEEDEFDGTALFADADEAKEL